MALTNRQDKKIKQIRIGEILHKWLKIEAAKLGMSIGQLVEFLLDPIINRKQNGKSNSK